MAWRRVPKSDDERLWRQRYMQNDATGEIVSRTKYQGIQAGKPRDRDIRERRKTSMNIQQFRARQSRAANREILELRARTERINERDLSAAEKKRAKEDRKIIKKYLDNRRKLKSGKKRGANERSKFEQVFETRADRRRFQEIFTRYPADTIREWLGSDENSRAIRAAWDSGKDWLQEIAA